MVIISTSGMLFFETNALSMAYSVWLVCSFVATTALFFPDQV